MKKVFEYDLKNTKILSLSFKIKVINLFWDIMNPNVLINPAKYYVYFTKLDIDNIYADFEVNFSITFTNFYFFYEIRVIKNKLIIKRELEQI